MSTIVFVPGMYHNADCFENMTEELNKRGYKATAVTCKGSELESKNRNVTFREITDSVVDFCKEIDDELIMVCHSSGGTIGLNSIPEFADKVEKVIFNDAFVMPHGMTQLDFLPPEIQDMFKGAAASTPDNTIPVVEEVVRGTLMSEASEDAVQELLKVLVPQPFALMDTPSNSNEFFKLENIPKRMLLCTLDKTYDGYVEMFKNNPGVTDEDIISIDGDHEAFFSNPELFIEGLVKCMEL